MCMTRNCNCMEEDMNIFKDCVRQIEYVINYDKRTVTAILTNTALDAIKPIRSKLGGIDVGVNLAGEPVNYDELNMLLIANKFVATVHCATTDVFDEETGKQLARTRVYAKYDKARVKAWAKYRAKLIEKENAIVSCIEKYSK